MRAIVTMSDRGRFPAVGTEGRWVTRDGEYRSEEAVIRYAVRPYQKGRRALVEFYRGDSVYGDPYRVVVVESSGYEITPVPLDRVDDVRAGSLHENPDGGKVTHAEVRARLLPMRDARYGWMIAKDHTELLEGERPAVGVAGPRNIDLTILRELMEGKGVAFRMLDDDNVLVYEGRIMGKYEGFEPLDDFGMPNAGCTSIQYREKGRWVTI